jgi:hypothetical protein
MEDEERREKRFLEFDLYFGEWSENNDKNEGRKKEEREKMNIVSLFVTTVGKGQVIGVFV